MTFLKWALMIIGVLILLIVVALVIGYSLPKDHKIKKSLYLKSTPEIVWRRINDFEKFSSWRLELSMVEKIDTNTWIEVDKSGQKIKYQKIASTLNKSLTTEIADKDLPFGGTWTFEITVSGDSAVLTIEENGHVNNPLFRFVSKFIIGHDKSIQTYFDNLKRYEENI